MPIFEKPIDPADIDADNLAYDVMARLQKQRGVSVVSVVAGMNQSVAGMNQSIADARTEQVEHGWSVGLLGAMSHSVE